MNRGTQGEYVTISTAGEHVQAFIPAPLPPDPPIEWSPTLREKFDQALLGLGRLDSVSMLLPDIDLYLYTFVRKEAVLSSQIEGTQSSLSDLLLFELDQVPGAPLDDVEEVSNYVSALNHGLRRLKENFPISLRLIREIHELLLAKGRGSHQTPGEFRRSQNWIGGTRPGNAVFVPPPPERLLECLGNLEFFLQDQPERTSPLLKAAFSHVQFETIHPFLDGNGRLGRLLITLILCESKVLHAPLLYLSLYFKLHRQQYYTLLNQIRNDGDWEAWLEFFADAVIETSIQAVDTARSLHERSEKDKDTIQSAGRISGSALRVHRAFIERPIASSPWLSEKTGLTAATVNKCLVRLEELGIVRELTDRQRNRLYSYVSYVDVMNRQTEAPFEE